MFEYLKIVSDSFVNYLKEVKRIVNRERLEHYDEYMQEFQDLMNKDCDKNE